MGVQGKGEGHGVSKNKPILLVTKSARQQSTTGSLV